MSLLEDREIKWSVETLSNKAPMTLWIIPGQVEWHTTAARCNYSSSEVAFVITGLHTVVSVRSQEDVVLLKGWKTCKTNKISEVECPLRGSRLISGAELNSFDWGGQTLALTCRGDFKNVHEHEKEL